ncbi:MAG: CPBP family intramembrane metalloprotease [Acidobacteria bacterium]|nr:CPBP family intramembrane metalloprotease [Acidobacteriota bacterium]
MFPQLVRIIFAVFLIAGVPALSWHSARPSRLQGIPKTALYLSAVVSQWILAGIGLGVVVATWPGWYKVCFHSMAPSAFLQWTVLLAVGSVLGLGFFLLLEHRGWWPEESEVVRLLVPENTRERWWALLGLAPTAGFCEEFLYRGFLLSEASGWFHSVVWGVVVSSVAFGLAHFYQGVNGMFRAALLGALLAYPVVRLGSLYPSMAAHFLIDATALLWLGPKFVKQEDSSGVMP